jgi:uncharacterized protein (TIGR02328 family)
VAIIRLWHYDLLPYLPKSQLLAQKRECDLIWKDIANDKQTNHILINYIWKYDVANFSMYYLKLYAEFEKRGYKFNVSTNYIPTKYFFEPYQEHHNKQYLIQCFYNLQEKYTRGQKDFDYETYIALSDFVRKEVNNYVK